MPMIVEIDLDSLDEERLYPDEDFIAQKAKDIPNGVDRFTWAKSQVQRYRGSWEMSLRQLGNIAHKGVVPRETIMRMASIDFDQARNDLGADAALMLAFAVGDPSITVMNKALMGEKYEELMKFFMGDPVDLEILVHGTASEASRSKHLRESFDTLPDSHKSLVEGLLNGTDRAMDLWKTLEAHRPIKIVYRNPVLDQITQMLASRV